MDKVTTFPRQPIEGGLLPVSEQGISVKLKRKLGYKGHHLHKTINPEKVVKAVEYFKAIGNPLYQEIDINSNYSPTFPSDEHVPEEEEVALNETTCDKESNCDNQNNRDNETNCDTKTICERDLVQDFDKNCFSLSESINLF